MTNCKTSDLNILEINIHDLAKQICLKDMELFKAITREELNSFYWAKKNKKSRCPNVSNSFKQFNKINLWAQGSILDHATTSKGVKVLTRFIKLSKDLLSSSNFQSAYAIKAALESTAIYRLEQLWKAVNKKNTKIWDTICYTFNVEDNYNNLRTTIEQRKPPLIPYLGVYLADLTGLDAAHPKVNGEETEIRKSSMGKFYDNIEYYQRFKYDFKEHRGIQDFIKYMNYMEEFESIMMDSYFFMSKKLEPNSSLTGSCSSHSSSQDNSPLYKRRSSPPLNLSRTSYRVLSEDERKKQITILPDSPTLTNDRHSSDSNSLCNGLTLKNIIDDSEVLPQNGTNANSHRHTLQHTKSIPNQSSQNEFALSPTLSSHNLFNSFRKSDIQQKSRVQFFDPDMLCNNRHIRLIFIGVVKRKVKSYNSVCISGYQKVLAKLFADTLDCFVNFYSTKTSKYKSEDDFKDEYQAKISLIDAGLKFESLKSNPKIYINLPHQHYVIQSIDDSHSVWPSIDKWWHTINESVDKVKASKAAVCQPQVNLINLEDDFTRL